MEETSFATHEPGRSAVLELLRAYKGKTIADFVIVEEPKPRADRQHSERLIIRFTDATEVAIQIGSNLNSLGDQDQGYKLKSADELSVWFYEV